MESDYILSCLVDSQFAIRTPLHMGEVQDANLEILRTKWHRRSEVCQRQHLMDPIDGDSSSKHTLDEQTHPALGNKPEIEKVTPNSSSSSSDGESFEEDFFQLDAAELDKSFLQNTEIASDKLASQSKTQNDKVNGTNDVGINDNLDMCQPNHSPPLQVTERSDVPNPNRISSSILTRTMSAAIDWSVVSNESLFSIQIGSSSFSRDHAFLTGRSRDVTNFPMDTYSRSPAEAANAAAMQGVLRVNEGKVDSKDKHPARAMHHFARDMHHFAGISMPVHSRMASFESFAFPVLTDGRRGSVKVGPVNQTQHSEQAQQRPPQTKTTEKAPAFKCFPCFSCSSCS